jgi:molecular chaperone GrpE
MSTDNSGLEREATLSLEECRAALAAAQQEQAELHEKFLRAAAANENTRKQAERAAAGRAAQQFQGFLLQLLAVADNLERALAFAQEGDPLVPGVQATLRQLLDVLRRAGVTPLEVAPGALFDPHSHEAVETVVGNVAEPTVAAVRQPGYLADGQVLRPAAVVVAKPQQAEA